MSVDEVGQGIPTTQSRHPDADISLGQMNKGPTFCYFISNAYSLELYLGHSSINHLTNHWSLFHKTWILANLSWNLLKRKFEYYRKEEGRHNKGNISRTALSKILGIISSRTYPFILKHLWIFFIDLWKDII